MVKIGAPLGGGGCDITERRFGVAFWSNVNV